MNMSVIFDNLSYFFVAAWPNGALGGIALTLLLSVFSACFSALLGLILGTLLVMSNGIAKNALTIFLGFFRAIPILLLIFWLFFLLPQLFGISAPRLTTVVAALSLVGGAYIAHSVAAGLNAVGSGQWAAGLALGFTRWQVLFYLILPQSLPRMMPSFINHWVSLVKDTSLAYIISVQEFLYVARQIDGRSNGAYSMEIYLFVGIVYFCICMAMSYLANYLNRRYSAKSIVSV